MERTISFLARKYVDDIDRCGGRTGAGCRREMAGLAAVSQPDGFSRDFTHSTMSGPRAGRSQPSLKPSVSLHLALVDQATLGLVHEFDRIPDGDDVIGPFSLQ
jgi:hypothetical protein